MKIKEYQRKYHIENKEKIAKQKHIWYIENKEKIAKQKQKYNKENREIISEKQYKYRNSKANYNTFAEQISYADEVKNINGFLQTKCAYCGKWYYPTVILVQHRIQSLNGNGGSIGSEKRLYCSESCKQECPIYRRQLYQIGHPKNFEDTSSREVQPELRQMVFERDNYTCQKCGIDVSLHCHHIEGIRWEPFESADIDMCVTVCKDCHIKIHKQEDCGYNDLQCKEF